MSAPAAIIVVAHRPSRARWAPVFAELGWDQAALMMKHFVVVVACAYNPIRVAHRTPILIGVRDEADIELAVQQASELLDDVLCTWVFACDGAIKERAVQIAELNSVVGGTA